jgi:hypothetical protein
MVQVDFSLMKNRYGMDGMTYYADVDVSTGRISKWMKLPESYLNLQHPPQAAFANEIDMNKIEKFFLQLL